ncbi:hypothetical protein KR009_004998 [Drosophila setifemur]|nr:hypothetical protein KR009_004998 [Drosophila setifemur]
MNCLKVCGFFFALIAALATAEAGEIHIKRELFKTNGPYQLCFVPPGTQVIHAGGHTLTQTDRGQYIRKN